MDSFLQSIAWLDFQKSLGRKVWQMDSTNIIKYNLPFGKSYLYSPHCEGNFLSEGFLKKVKEIAEKENSIFFKVEPLRQVSTPSSTRGAQGKPVLKKFGFRKSQNIQPQKTLILDVTKPEKELLNQMHHKTRYNIRLAERKGILVKKDKNKFDNFWKLLQQTTKRDGFRPHPKEYYKKMLEIPDVELFVAIFKEKIVAVNIIVFFKKQAIYLHGASDYQYRNLMAPHLLQWQQILEAKKRECTEYDFWGINEKKWPGVTRFKKGFAPQSRSDLRGPVGPKARGSREVDYLGAYDLVFQPIWYRIYKIAKKVL